MSKKQHKLHNIVDPIDCIALNVYQYHKLSIMGGQILLRRSSIQWGSATASLINHVEQRELSINNEIGGIPSHLGDIRTKENLTE